MQLKAIKIRKVFVLFTIVLMAFLVLVPYGQAQICNDKTGVDCAKAGLDQAAGTNFKKDANVDQMVGGILNAALSLLGIVFVLLMVYGGFLWMTARGDERQVAKAQELIQAAIIGLIIVIGAYAITYFLIYNLEKNTLTGT